MSEYTIPNLFLEAFGLKVSSMYKPELSTGNPDTPQGLFTGVEIVEDENDTNNKSAYGTQVLWPLVFQSGSYKEYNQQGEIVSKAMGSFRLPIASIVSFRRDKRMTETNINGGKDSVKEIYGFSSWVVTINGFLIPDASQPQGFKNSLEQEKELNNWDNLASSISVFGKPFSVHKIFNLTIKSMNFEPMRGKPNIRAFTINALSDQPIELNIKSSV